jgi:hypothetical protein
MRSRPPDSPDFRAQLHTRFQDLARLWHVGVLYNRDPRFAQILMELLHREEGLVLGDNEPYSVTDASDYTIPVHGEQRDCTMWHSKFAKTSSRTKRVNGNWRRCLCDCFRKLMSGPIACRSPSEPEGSIRTLDADHEHNCCIPSVCSP